VLVGVDCDDIKSTDAVRVLIPLGEEYGSGSDQFALFVNIYGEPGAGKVVTCAITHLDEHEARPVAHDQVDLTEAGAEILADLGQALA
jgi:hypothetical protein